MAGKIKIIYMFILFMVLQLFVTASDDIKYIGEITFQKSQDINSLVVDDVGRIYLSENGKKTIKVYNKFGSHIDSIILAGDNYFLKGGDINIDKKGNVIVIDSYQNSLSKFNSEGDILFSLTNKSKTFFRFPKTIAVDDSDKIFVADTGNKKIQVYNDDGVFLGDILSGDKLASETDDLRLLKSDIFSGTPIPKTPVISEPSALAVNKGYIFILDSTARFIFIYNHTFDYMGNINLRVVNDLKNISPCDIAVYKNNIYVLDKENHNIKVFDIKGKLLKEIGSKGTGRGQFFRPAKVDITNNKLYVLDMGNNRVQMFSFSNDEVIILKEKHPKIRIALFDFYFFGQKISKTINLYDLFYQKTKDSGKFAVLDKKKLAKAIKTLELKPKNLVKVEDLKGLQNSVEAELAILGGVSEKENTYNLELTLCTMKTLNKLFVLKKEIAKDSLNSGITDLIIELERKYFNRLGAPSVPKNLTYSATTDSVFLSWDVNPEEDVIGYNIYYSVKKDDQFQKVGETSLPRYEYKHLSLHSSNFFKISAIDSEGKESLSSIILFAKLQSVPDFGFILDVKSKKYAKRVEFQWTNPEKEKIHEYKVYRSDFLNGEYRLIGSTKKRKFAETGLEDGKDYYYKIKKVYSNGLLSAFSNSFTCSTDERPLNVIAFKAISDLPKKIVLEWQRNKKDRDVKEYVIYRSPSVNGSYQEIKRLSSRYDKYEDSNLQNNTNYYYKIKSVDKHGLESDLSNEVYAITKSLPQTPFNLTAESNLARKIKIKWDFNRKEFRDIEFIVYRSESIHGAFDIIGKSLQKEYIDLQVKDNKEYYYFICSKDEDELISKPSEVVQAKTKPLPLTPKLIKALAAQPQKVTLVWEKDDNPDIKSYFIYRAKKYNAKYHKIGEAEQSMFIDDNNQKGLKDGKTYYYSVSTVDIDGLESFLSDPVVGKSKSIPSTPVDIVADIRKDSIVLSWPPVVGDDIFGYVVYKNRKKIKIVKSNLFVDSNVKFGKKYAYHIAAIDQSNLESKKSKKLSIRFKY